MSTKTRFTAMGKTLTALALAVTLLTSALASDKFKVVHHFADGIDGEFPLASLAFDRRGNLYGTTSGGGAYTSGTVFVLSPSAQGPWRKSLLHSFSYKSDGGDPRSGLIFDGVGDFYGTTSAGGPHLAGTVFKLTPGSSGWTFSLVYDGDGSSGDLVLDKAGDLYGTIGPGNSGAGAVAELTPGPCGWSNAMLYSFGSQQDDGNAPYAGLAWDMSGNLYGTTIYGGDFSCSQGCGTVFQLSPNSSGWHETVLHRFSGKDGRYPYAGVIFDRAGNLYTAASDGGGNGSDYGSVYKLTRGYGGKWTGTVLHRFQNLVDGAGPVSTPVMDSAGNLYGTAEGGNYSCNGGCGVVYKLTPRAKGPWQYTILHKFNGSDGVYPDGGVILDGKGHLYGTTIEGGAHGYGVVYEITL
jgi:uncharacterized repeat protein (TIGR03803 family)